MKYMFDLTERVKAGLNFLQKNVDERKECLPYFWTLFNDDPAEARHDWPDFGDLTARYVESFVAARAVLNIAQPCEVEQALRKLLLGYFSENDGLSYRPAPAKPYYSTILKADYDAHVAEGFDQARVLWALLTWLDDTDDPAVAERLDALVTGLDRVFIRKDDYGYYDRSFIAPGTVVDPNAEPMPNQFYFSGPQIQPLTEAYRRFGNDTAGDMARRITKYIVTHTLYIPQWQMPSPLDMPWSLQRLDAPAQAAGTGHGDCDYYVFAVFADAVQHHVMPEFDVYKAVETSAPAICAAQSIENGNIPIDVPDFRPGPKRRPGQMPT